MVTLKSGDILHCTGKSIISKIIMFVNNTDISHTAMFISIWYEPYIIESSFWRVRLIPYQKWIKNFNGTFQISRILDIDEKEVCSKAMNMINIPYNYFFLIKKLLESINLINFIEKISKFFNIAIFEYKYNNRLVCSMLVGFAHNIDKWEKMTPKDLYEKTKKYIIL